MCSLPVINEIDSRILQSGEKWKTPLLIGTCTLGQVRFEWAAAINHMIIPVNLSMSNCVQPYNLIAPMRYHVAEGQNLIVKTFLEGDYESLLFIEDDVIPPPNILLQMAKWIRYDHYPMLSGWYNVKCYPPQPMFFKGRGNGPVYYSVDDVEPEPIYEKFGLEGVMCDGIPTGCTLISRKLLQVAWDESKDISLERVVTKTGLKTTLHTREVFRTQREAGVDPESGGYYKKVGTSDLEFCDRAMQNGWFKKAGYDHLDGVEYPFPVDTSIKCGHIDLTTGVVY